MKRWLVVVAAMVPRIASVQVLACGIAYVGLQLTGSLVGSVPPS